MATYIQLIPEFSTDVAAGTISMAVAAGVLSFTIRPGSASFVLVKHDGSELTCDLSHHDEGALPRYYPYDEFGAYTGVNNAAVEAEFYDKWKNDAGKMARGLVLANIGNLASDHMSNINAGIDVQLAAGQLTKYKPFPAELPDFSVKLTVVSE